MVSSRPSMATASSEAITVSGIWVGVPCRGKVRVHGEQNEREPPMCRGLKPCVLPSYGLLIRHTRCLVLYPADSAVYRYPKERRWLQGFPSLKSVRGRDDIGWTAYIRCGCKRENCDVCCSLDFTQIR